MGNGGPMGRLVSPLGFFFNGNRWQHATMYMFWGLSGVCDILSYTAKHVIPAGIICLKNLITFLFAFFTYLL